MGKRSYDIGREMLGEDEIIRLSSRMPALVAEAVRRNTTYLDSQRFWVRRVPCLVHHPTRARYLSIRLSLIAENVGHGLFDSSRSLRILFSQLAGTQPRLPGCGYLSLTGHIQTLMRDHRGFDLDLANGVDARRIEARLLDVRHQDYFQS